MSKSRLKKLLSLNILVITAIGVILAIGSSHFLNVTDLPEDNFTRMSIVKKVSSLTCDTSDPDNCMQEDIVLMEGYASGLVFKTIDSISYTLTAAHFCDPYNFPSFLFSENELTTELTMKDLDDNLTEAEILYMNHEYDLCLVSSEDLSVDDIHLSNSYPVLGEKVYAIEIGRAV